MRARKALGLVLLAACASRPSDETPSESAPAPSAAPSGVDAPPMPTTCAPAPAAASDVAVTIHVDRGPHGAAAPVRIDRRAYGMNIADWRPQDDSPPSATFLAYLTALRPGVLRWPAGHRSQEYVWPRGGGGQSGSFTLTPEHVDTFLALARAVSAEPVIGVNVKRGTPAAAADLVRYLNVEKNYGVKWIYVGNEPDLVDGITPGPDAYANELIAFTDAIRAVDPSVQFVGPELLTGAHVGGFDGTVDWMTPILRRAGARLAGISWHYYPLDSGQSYAGSSAVPSLAHLFQESAPDWAPAGMGFADMVMPALASLRDTYAAGAEIWITELAEDPGPRMGQGISDTLAAALWSADALGRYLEYGPGAVMRFLFEGDAAHYYALLDTSEKPRPTYGAYWLYARFFGDRVVDATSSSRAAVAAHAALRSDGALTVVLVNKTESASRVHVDVSGACNMHASASTLEAAGDLAATTFRVDGVDLGTAEAAALAPAAVSAPFDLVVPPASIRLVVYTP